MSPHKVPIGWNTTDEADDTSAVEPRATTSHDATEGPGHDIRGPSMQVQKPQYTQANPWMLRASAVTGIVAVFIVLAFTFGVFGLQGDITGTGNDTVTVIISADGHFVPSDVTVNPGTSLVLKNENENPQVLKPKDGRDLFPVQVLFNDPYTTTIPAEAEGTYTYISETLPDSESVRITVEPKATPITANEPTPVAIDPPIPLPFGGETPVVAQEQPKLQVVPVATAPAPVEYQATVTTEHSEDSVVVSVGGSSKQSIDTSTIDPSKIPTNPYTVEEGKKMKDQQSKIAAAALENQTLHSGAPLQQLRNNPPRRMTDTGPQGMWLLFVPALLGLGWVYRRTVMVM